MLGRQKQFNFLKVFLQEIVVTKKSLRKIKRFTILKVDIR